MTINALVILSTAFIGYGWMGTGYVMPRPSQSFQFKLFTLLFVAAFVLTITTVCLMIGMAPTDVALLALAGSTFYAMGMTIEGLRLRIIYKNNPSLYEYLKKEKSFSQIGGHKRQIKINTPLVKLLKMATLILLFVFVSRLIIHLFGMMIG